jgi:hypothetical protein
MHIFGDFGIFLFQNLQNHPSEITARESESVKPVHQLGIYWLMCVVGSYFLNVASQKKPYICIFFKRF